MGTVDLRMHWVQAPFLELWHLATEGAQLTICGRRMTVNWLDEGEAGPPRPQCQHCVRIAVQRDDQQPSPFGLLLAHHRTRLGQSRNALAHQVGVDPSYLTRIEWGDREPPRRHIVDALARELHLTPLERDQLLLRAGYSPSSINGSGWSEALHLAAELLNDYSIPEADRAVFEQTIKTMAAHWRPRSEDR